MSLGVVVLENAELVGVHLKKSISDNYKAGNNNVNVDSEVAIRIIADKKKDRGLGEEIKDKDKRIELELGMEIDVVNKDNNNLEVELKIRYKFAFDILDDEIKKNFMYGEMDSEFDFYMNNMINLGYANIRNDIQDMFLKGNLDIKVPYNMKIKEISALEDVF